MYHGEASEVQAARDLMQLIRVLRSWFCLCTMHHVLFRRVRLVRITFVAMQQALLLCFLSLAPTSWLGCQLHNIIAEYKDK